MAATGYLAFPDQASALKRSADEARARGCAPDGTTQYWWEVREDPTTPGQWLVLMDDARTDFAAARLAVAERGKVAAVAAVLTALDATAAIDVVEKARDLAFDAPAPKRGWLAAAWAWTKDMVGLGGAEA